MVAELGKLDKATTSELVELAGQAQYKLVAMAELDRRLSAKPAVKGKVEATAPTHTASKVAFIVKPPPWTTNAGEEKQTYRITIGGLTANCKEDRYQKFVKAVGLKAIH